jgi:hypothetical protein
VIFPAFKAARSQSQHGAQQRHSAQTSDSTAFPSFADFPFGALWRIILHDDQHQDSTRVNL